MNTLNNKYKIKIYERYSDLKKLNKPELNNNDLWKIFEYYSCIKLSEEYKKQFYEYDDIDPDFKELNNMSRYDTGIDLCDLDKTIVQCKLRVDSLSWKECSTFFGSQVIFDEKLGKAIVRWQKLIITRNNDCKLTDNLLDRKKLFIDKPYAKQELIQFCDNLIANPPKYPVFNADFNLRDYQKESIELIKKSKKNVIINLPTGTGKNMVIIYSLKKNKKYLILVPRIILMDQLKDEIIKHKPKLENKIQLIGDSNDKFDEDKLITICVFNSVSIIEKYCDIFKKIFVDEAHHIDRPAIYYENDDDCDMSNNVSNDKSDNESDNESDDKEDELKNVKSYTQIIKSLIKYNNNVYLSATIDKINGFEYYTKDIRDMINLGYLCDYTIHIPIFSEDPNNRKICEHLIQKYRNIIIYCNSQKEGKIINKLMNKIQKNCSEYVDCFTSKNKRNIILNKFKEGKIPFLVNVKILIEGFDACISQGVCFMHLPTSKTTLIQIVGRCLRLHPNKTIANVILPFSSKEDEKNIGGFLKTMAKNDSRIRKSYENKRVGGYISIDLVEEDIDDEEINNNIELKYNMVFDSMGILKNEEEIWMKKLEKIIKYIDENNKRPSKTDKNKDVKIIGNWLLDQQTSYKNKINIMKNQKIYSEWKNFITSEKYGKYFLSNEDKWIEKLNILKKYINENKKTPIVLKKTKNSIGEWFIHQKYNYKKKIDTMKNFGIYTIWTEFITSEKYEKYFLSNEEQWNNKFNDLKKYIDENNKIPSQQNRNENIKVLGAWFYNQIQNYKNKKKIMKKQKIYNIWTEFMTSEKYKKYFASNIDEWFDKFNNLKKYIDENKKTPSARNINAKLISVWFSTQKYNYRNKAEIMKNQKIYDIWTEFIISEKYSNFFITNEEKWINNFNKLKKYIDEHKKTPSTTNYNTKLMKGWVDTQKQNYKNKEQIMKNQKIYEIWGKFITSEKYGKYFN